MSFFDVFQLSSVAVFLSVFGFALHIYSSHKRSIRLPLAAASKVFR